MLKKALSILLSVILLLGIFSVLPISTFAQDTSLVQQGADIALADTGITQDEAVNWIKTRANEGWWQDVDGVYGCQCVDLIQAYYQFFGYARMSGNAGDYVSGHLPAGSNWYYSSTPVAGSVFVRGYDNGNYPYGHVGLVYAVSGSTMYTVETNVQSPYDGGYSHARAMYRERNVSFATTFINPAFTNPVPKPSGAWIKVNKSSAFVGQSVTFTFGANNATNYTIGINRNGTRIITEAVTSGKSYTFNLAGEYTAYVSAYNSVGYVDSNVVSFTIKDKVTITKKMITVSGWTVIDKDHHKPRLSIVDGRTVLKEDRDYSVSTEKYQQLNSLLASPVDIGYNYRATVTGIGGYTGSITLYERTDLNNCTVTVTTWTLTNGYYKPTVQVLDNTSGTSPYYLKNNVDYKIEKGAKQYFDPSLINPHVSEPCDYIVGIGKYYGAQFLPKRTKCEKGNYNVSGTITSALNNTESITVSLHGYTNILRAYSSTPKYKTVVSGNKTSFSLPNIEPGKYKLSVSKKNHPVREYEITVGDNLAQLNVVLHPLGDINGDNKITTTDFGMANSHSRGKSKLTGYQFSCADIYKDGKITTVDAGRINSHARGKAKLW